MDNVPVEASYMIIRLLTLLKKIGIFVLSDTLQDGLPETLRKDS